MEVGIMMQLLRSHGVVVDYMLLHTARDRQCIARTTTKTKKQRYG